MHLDPYLFDISWSMVLEKFIRSGVVYLFLVVTLRVFGKRELAQLNPFDFVVFMTLSNAVQNAIIGNDNSSLLGGVTGAAALMLVNRALVTLRSRLDSPAVEALVEGHEDVLVKDGKIDEKRLKHELMTVQDLEIAARKQGFRSLQEVDFAALEPGGGICFIAKSPSPQDEHFRQLLVRLDELQEEIRSLRKA